MSSRIWQLVAAPFAVDRENSNYMYLGATLLQKAVVAVKHILAVAVKSLYNSRGKATQNLFIFGRCPVAVAN